MENKIKILKTLKDFGKLPSSRVSAIAGMNYDSLKKEIIILKKKGLIKSTPIGDLATYLEITNKGIKYLEDKDVKKN